MDFAEKLKAIRANEQLTQSGFCELVGLSINSLKKYEAAIYEMGYGSLSKVLEHPRFTKYTLWLMTGHTARECGQISPIE